ncbi:aKG-HExxH-type peptide beta-hydroxylase [Streptomyces xiaopingdaonensis]|uniref:aKG-HExxH-type peptide beta-hydroxylase n=1 Tax=Streptomyces xiaopingdaonensis TaxID=1565415 RepID=UPI00031CE9C0|nr:HEXXH motif-containing putative peptide modification protein [Streptomyces xiaopingdaonensis]
MPAAPAPRRGAPQGDPRLHLRAGAGAAQPADRALLRRLLHHRRLVLLRALWERTAELGPPSPHFTAAWRLLEAAEHRSPAAVRRVLLYPTVGLRLAAALSAPEGPRASALAGFGEIACAAAVAARVPAVHRLAPPSDSAVLPGLGRFTAIGGELTLPYARAAVRPRRLPGAAARLDDVEPLHAADGTPTGVRTDRRTWSARFGAALGALTAVDAAGAAEVRSLLQCVLPLPEPPRGGGHSSMTLRAAPGAVFTTLPADAHSFAAVLVHEIQHTKLALLDVLRPLHTARNRERYEVGWRSDPRPVEAALQGTFAHLALAELWHRLATGRPPRAAAVPRSHEAWQQTARTLAQLRESAELTYEGRQFVRGMVLRHTRLGRGLRRRRPAGVALPETVIAT